MSSAPPVPGDEAGRDRSRPEGGQGVVGRNGRDVPTVVDWIQAQTPAFRAGITDVAIDMSAGYANAVRQALPHARIVVDHFHVVMLSADAGRPVSVVNAPGVP